MENSKSKNIQQYQKTIHQFLITAIMLVFLPVTAIANVAGNVNFAMGGAQVVHSGGLSETLRKGMSLSEGDTIDTGLRGMAQIRFTDGAYVSLRKGTVFKIDEYHYKPKQAAEKKAPVKKKKNRGFFSLLRGGFRTITGLLGKDSEDSYRVKTTVATIGIRGTEYLAELGDSLSFSVADGAVEICNSAGCQFFREDEFGNIADSKALIKRVRDMGLDVVVSEVDGKTVATVEGSEDFAFSVGDETDDDGGSAILAEATQIVPDCSTGGCYLAFAELAEGVNKSTSVTAAFSKNAMTSYSSLDFTDSIGTATATSAGSTTDIAWGRWTGGITTDGLVLTGSPVKAFHYVIGTPTPNFNTVSGGFDYALDGYTTPTTTIAGLGSFIGLTGTVGVHFDYDEMDFNIAVEYANKTYTIDGIKTNLIATGGGFSTSSVHVDDGASCTSCPVADLEGFFAGANAKKMGLTYRINENGTIDGAAVFGKTSTEYIGGAY